MKQYADTPQQRPPAAPGWCAHRPNKEISVWLCPNATTGKCTLCFSSLITAWRLIHINARRTPKWKIFRMAKINTRDFGVARLVTILIVLLFAPLTASATGSAASSSGHSEHGVVSDRCADHCLNIEVQSSSPAETPLHCHLKSPQPQQDSLNQAPVKDELPLLTLHVIPTPARQTGACIHVTSVRAPIAGPPSFILFGNFRS